MKKTAIYIFCIALLSTFGAQAQLSTSQRKILKEANDFYFDGKYADALPLFIHLDSVYFDYVVKYRIGNCYLHTDYQKLRALPYLEEVCGNEYLEVPYVVHFELGNLYHYIYKFEEAINQYTIYLNFARKEKNADKKIMDEAERMIEICHNAIEITSQPFNAEIELVSSSINTMESEYNPMISADEKTMVFMRTTGLNTSKDKKTNILLARKNEENDWDKAVELNIENAIKYKDQTITLAGLSSDGQTIFLNIGTDLDQDIYSANIYGNNIINIKKLNKLINTPYFEGGVSLSSDGTELYFVSDRPGGFGGTDIYRSKLNRKGDWDDPENLGEVINTIYNEQSPFLHPDNVTLFFSSEGHKTIGGSDIFKSRSKNGHWSEPENVSVLNSTKDDLYFVLNANGQIGYFSSSKNNIYDKHNIYKVSFKDPIPLTLVKGKILAGDPPKPIAAEIRVYDNETGERIKYIYNPNSDNGKYLMIFPPAKNYDILISSNDYLPQLVNVYIPYQTYFYELYQEIILQPICIKNKVVGEKVTVNNTFYDLYKTQMADSILSGEIPKEPAYYQHLLDLVEEIIQTTDTIKFNYVDKQGSNSQRYSKTDQLIDLINEAIETTDPVTLSILDANAQQQDKIRSTYFYIDGKKETALDTIIIGKDTLYTAPLILTKENTNNTGQANKAEYNSESEIIKIRNSNFKERSYIHKFTIYFDLDKDEINSKYFDDLEDICKLLLDNDNIGAEIYGYADASGEQKYNLALSKQRARTVLKYLLDRNIDQRKLITKGFGEIENPNPGENDELNRKVEINIFELSPE